MTRASHLILPASAMTLIVLASNILVQFPMHGSVGDFALGDLFTFGTFTYPLAFLVTDLTNRLYGPRTARRAVYTGFATAVIASIVAPPILFDAGLLAYATAGERLARVAIASGIAFLCAHLLDITVFNALRGRGWWKAPAFGSLAGSVLDTLIFFTVAFGAFFVLLGPNEPFALEPTPFLGIGFEAPRWLSWAFGDLGIKLLIAVLTLIPYRLAIELVLPAGRAEMRPNA